MTGLLVSVRSAAEARSALAGGASVIDVKEPDRGALGAADVETWRAVLEVVAGRVPVSAALGELFGDGCGPASVHRLATQTAGLAFAKIGLAGAARHHDWQDRWRGSLDCLPISVATVAVAYADWDRAQAPKPEAVIDVGSRLGCRIVLLDTFHKEGGHLLDHLPLAEVADLSRRTRAHGMSLVLAGSLTRALIPQVLPLAPEFVAVRGAACRENRRGVVDAELVRALANDLSPGAPGIRRAAASSAAGA